MFESTNCTVTSTGAVETTPEQSTDQLAKNYSLVWQVYDALGDVNHKGDIMSYPLLDLLKTGAWKQFRANNGKEYRHNYFGDFVVAPIPSGLETTHEKLRAIVRGEGEAERLVEEALMRGDGNPKGTNQYTGATLDNIQGSSKAPTGTSRAATIRRIVKIAHDSDNALSAQAEALLDEIYSGKKSANKAAQELGLRKKPRSVNDPNLFDLTELTEKVRLEMENRQQTEGWSTKELIEEALRQYFPVLQSLEIEDAEQELPEVNQTGGSENTEQSSRTQELIDGRLKGVQIAEILGKPANQIGPFVARAHKKGRNAVLTTQDGSRTFIREPGFTYWREATNE